MNFPVVNKTAILRLAGISVATSLCMVATTTCMSSKANQAVEILKYFNPKPHKTYLNESQDRLIKKKSFKAGDVNDYEAVNNKEIGFFAIVKPTDETEKLEALLARPDVSGLSTIVSWRTLEPSEDDFKWAPIDRLLDLAARHDKYVILRVSTCGTDAGADSDTPKWVFDSGVKSLSFNGPDGKPRLMPIFWDTAYLAKWNNFIREMGDRYDKNPHLHSIGITGGGLAGGTAIVPVFSEAGTPAKGKGVDKAEYNQLEETLKRDHSLNQRKIVEHWKYVGDLFPKAFPSARLNFDIDPPTPNRAGQDALDEISDYLVYRYGQRIYLTRQNVADAKHGFDQYRVLLKFRPDTYTGYQLTSAVDAQALDKLSHFALDDGISFIEMPAELLTSSDKSIQQSLQHLRSHLGYQIVYQKAELPPEIGVGSPLTASFTFVNLGSANPKRPSRNLDKDVAASFKIQVELRDASGKPVVLSRHTPETPTTNWAAGKPVTWTEELRMPKLALGEYSVYLSIVDPDTKPERKINFINASGEKPLPQISAPIGKIKVVPAEAMEQKSS